MQAKVANGWSTSSKIIYHFYQSNLQLNINAYAMLEPHLALRRGCTGDTWGVELAATID